MLPTILTPDELVDLTGYRRPSAQLAELHRLGFNRARRAPVSGAVILERAHYEAVARGEFGTPSSKPRPAPQLRPA